MGARIWRGQALKTCTGCGKTKDKSLFTRNRCQPDGRNYQCKDCYRWAHRVKKYGMGKAEYYELLDAQEGVCAICKGVERDFMVDHCHKTGVIRGLLCRKCNTGLGMFDDVPNLLRQAADYLDEFKP